MVHGHRGAVDVGQHQRSRVAANRHNEGVLELVAEVVGCEGMPHRMDLPECAGAGCYDACSCLDGHTDHQPVGVRMAQLASHLVPLQLDPHF